MALNSVAPCRRAESMNVLAEKPRQEREARPRADRAEHRVGGRVDVKQRQRGHQAVVRPKLHPPREALARHHVGPMGLRDQLGAPGRARGRDEHGRVVGAGRARALDPGGRLEEPRDVDHVRRAPLARRRHHPVEAGVGDDEPRPHLADQPGLLGLGAAGVGGDQDRARVGRRQPGEQVVRRAAHRGEHEIAAADSPALQPGGRPADAVAGLGVGVRLVPGHEPHLAGHGRDGLVEELGDRPWHGRGSSRVARAWRNRMHVDSRS